MCKTCNLIRLVIINGFLLFVAWLIIKWVFFYGSFLVSELIIEPFINMLEGYEPESGIFWPLVIAILVYKFSFFILKEIYEELKIGIPAIVATVKSF